MPGYVEWLLAFPRAPRGSVSIQIWGIACASVIGMVGSAVAAGFVLVKGKAIESRGNEKSGGMESRKQKKAL